MYPHSPPNARSHGPPLDPPVKLHASPSLGAAVGLGWLMSDMWTAPVDDPRSYGNPLGEKATYREYLGNYRLTIEMKCEGLDASQLARRSVPPSTLSLLGLARHLAQVESHW